MNQEARRELIERYEVMRGVRQTVGSYNVMNDEKKPRIYFKHYWVLMPDNEVDLLFSINKSTLNNLAWKGKVLRIRKNCKFYYLKHQLQEICRKEKNITKEGIR